MSAGAWFKAATCQKPTPAREREITDELIERQAKRIDELEQDRAELLEALERLSRAYMVMRIVPPEPGHSDYGAVKQAQEALKAAKATT